MMFSLKNKSVVITGGGSGIGRAISILFAQQGAEVNILELNPTTAEETVNQIVKNGGVANAYACELPDRSDGPILKIGKKAKLIVTNKAATPRYLYVYAIDDSYEVNLAIPERRGIDTRLDEGKAIAVEGSPTSKGRLTFLTLSTTEPIKADVLEQSGIAARGTNCNVSALARALCAAQRGERDAEGSRVGDWSATVVTAIVK